MIQRQPGKISVRSWWNRIISKNCFDVVAKEVNYFCLFLFHLFSLRWPFFLIFFFNWIWIVSQRKNHFSFLFFQNQFRSEIKFSLRIYIFFCTLWNQIYFLYLLSFYMLSCFSFKKNHVFILLAFLSSIILSVLSPSSVNDSLIISVFYLISFIPSPLLYFVTTIIYSNQNRFYFLYYNFVIICGLLKFFFLPYVKNLLAHLNLQVYQVNLDVLKLVLLSI